MLHNDKIGCASHYKVEKKLMFIKRIAAVAGGQIFLLLPLTLSL